MIPAAQKKTPLIVDFPATFDHCRVNTSISYYYDDDDDDDDIDIDIDYRYGYRYIIIIPSVPQSYPH